MYINKLMQRASARRAGSAGCQSSHDGEFVATGRLPIENSTRADRKVYLSVVVSLQFSSLAADGNKNFAITM
jgi:hypothetical protein